MESAKKQLISGVTYTAIAKYSGMVISLIVTAILARLIQPSDFGIVAIATVIIAFFGLFSDLGIAPAIIQDKDLSDNDLSAIFSFTLWTGILLSIIFFISSWFIAGYYHSPVLRPICQLLSISLLFNAVNTVPNALLMKDKKFRFIAFRTLIIQLAGGIISVIAALSGAGLYALLINPILSSILVFVISYKEYPQQLKKTWGIDSMRKIFSFSFYQFLFNIINFFSRNLDKLLIGKYMNMTLLGYYEKSYRLMMLPLQNITHVITPVMHPVLSDFQNDLKHLSWSYLKIVKLLVFVGLPLSVFLWFSSQEIILIVFGSQWEEAIPIFQILSLTVGIQIVMSTSGSIFQAANNTKNMFISGFLSAIFVVTGIFIGIFVFKTLEAVAWAICISFFVNFVQCYVIMYKFTLKINIVHFFKQFVSPLILSGILVALFWSTAPFLKDLNLLVRILLKGLIFMVIILLYIQCTKAYNIKKIALQLKDKTITTIKSIKK